MPVFRTMNIKIGFLQRYSTTGGRNDFKRKAIVLNVLVDVL
jgi:hypothetical protein